MPTPIRLALIGAGIYMRDTHAPSLRQHPDLYQIIAVYSRTEESAQRVAAGFDYPVAIYTDLDAILQRNDVEAVDIALPIDLMPDAIERARAAGKHVISEKPAAPDLATARRLLTLDVQYPATRWVVAENWRYEPGFREAKQLLDAGTIGTPLFAHWTTCIRMDETNPYYHTGWRRTPAYQGGFLYDVGVHHAAAWRLLLGQIVQVTAFASAVRPDLPPVDTLSAALQFDSGLLAQYAVTFANGAPYPPHLHILGSDGALRVDRPQIEILRGDQIERIQIQGVYPRSHVTMFADFARALRGEDSSTAGAPSEALADIAFVEALLRSAENGRAEQVEIS
ncbi:MAG: Gfo/Idh/MocA family oxidoreductase [Chloroflexota bacterium]|nr:Gfo/Idh/MocA family oxidoreductase [Chloroflexota bacterium]